MLSTLMIAFDFHMHNQKLLKITYKFHLDQPKEFWMILELSMSTFLQFINRLTILHVL